MVAARDVVGLEIRGSLPRRFHIFITFFSQELVYYCTLVLLLYVTHHLCKCLHKEINI